MLTHTHTHTRTLCTRVSELNDFTWSTCIVTSKEHQNDKAGDCLMIAFITCNSNLVPLLEGLCSSNPCRFEFSIFWVSANIVHSAVAFELEETNTGPVRGVQMHLLNIFTSFPEYSIASTYKSILITHTKCIPTSVVPSKIPSHLIRRNIDLRSHECVCACVCMCVFERVQQHIWMCTCWTFDRTPFCIF